MNDKKNEMVQAWLKKAENDMITADQTLLLVDGPTDTVCFHAQQAVEKALKALLTDQSVVFPKIHDTLRLLDLVIPFAPDFEKYRAKAAELSDYAIEMRYPSDSPEPVREEAMQALHFAKSLVGEIKGRLHLKGL